MRERKNAAQHRAIREKAVAEQLAEITRKHEIEIAIESALPPDFLYSDIFVSALYGTVGDVRIGGNPYYGEEESRCTLVEISQLLAMFPPVELVKVKDGCVSFRTRESVADWLGGKPQKGIGENAEVDPVAAVTLKADSQYSYGQTEIKVEWPTRLANGLVINIEAVLRPSEHPVRFNIEAKRDRSTGTVLEVRKCELQATREGFWMDHQVKWGRGGHDSANTFTLYWDAPDVPYPQWWTDTVLGGR